MFDFRQLRYFVAVSEELSFTRAARRLHISQPPLSQQIQALEQDLGVRLFDRTRRSVALTEAGRLFLSHALHILARADEARGQLSAAAAGFSGQLRLAYTVSVSFHPALPRILLRHGQMAPQMRLQLGEMGSEQQFNALIDKQIDVGLVRAEPASAALTKHLRLAVIDREPLLLALPSGHPLATRSLLGLDHVADQPFVSQPRALAATLYDRLVYLAGQAGFSPRIAQHTQQINGLLAMVAGGLGLALVPASMRAVRLAGVSYVPLSDPHAYLMLAVASRSNDQSPALMQFLSLVIETAVHSGL